MLKGKIKLGGCITNTILVLGILLFGYISVLAISSFFDGEYYNMSALLGGTFAFILFALSLYCLLPQRHSKKIMLVICIIWSVMLMILAIIGYVNRERSVEHNLLGEWIAETDEIKSKVVFEGNENDLEGTWSIYDYGNGKKEVIDFEVEDIENYTMEIVTEDGDIMFVPFAVSKDTLYFNNIKHKNPDKNVKIPKKMKKYDRYKTYVSNGVITPVGQGLFIGMTMDEVENVIKPATLQEEIGYYCYEMPETDISCHLDFFKGHLNEIELYIDDMDTMDGAIWYLSELYGNYTKERWTTNDKYIQYRWESDNLTVELNCDTEENTYYWIRYDYSIFVN